jgi:hypothetical protein
MSRKSNYINSVKAITTLQSKTESKTESKSTTNIDPGLAMLRSWQSQRLLKTHKDLFESRRFGPACRFFLNEVYAPKDFSQRNDDIEYLYEMMSSVLPNFLLKLVNNAIKLNNLTDDLDNQLLAILTNELGVTDHITPEQYTEAYRINDNYDQRVEQIELIVEIGHEVDISTRIPLVGMTLRLARGPAYRAGWANVHDFLQKGYTAFKKMGRAKAFLATIKQRELDLLDRIYAGETNPF